MKWPSEKGTEVIPAYNPAALERGTRYAAGLLRQGRLVAFPTETVYGLGADALSPQAVKKIFTAKGRPADNPLIVHIDSLQRMEELAKNIPPDAMMLAQRFWPGPLTLVLTGKDMIPQETTGGLGTVALRVPDHPVALALLAETGKPLAAPSANLSGRPSPTTARHVLDDLAGRIDAVLDGGPCGVGLESTVLDIRDGNPVLLRPGKITAAEIFEVIGKEPEQSSGLHEAIPLSPGLKYAHYAPRALFCLVRGEQESVRRHLKLLQQKYEKQGSKVGLLLCAESSDYLCGEHVEILGPCNEPAILAANLYSSLRRLDDVGVDIILAEGYTETGIGQALMDRMIRAAGGRLINVGGGT